MTGFESVKVSWIKDYLEQEGVDTTDLKGKAACVAKCEELSISPENIVSEYAINVDEEFELPTEDDMREPDYDSPCLSDEPQPPKYGTYEWNEYILGLMEDGELQEGVYPKVEGLRRLANEQLGDIIFSGSIELRSNMPEDQENSGRAYCVYEVQIEWSRLLAGKYIDINSEIFQVRTFRGVGGAYKGNTPKPPYYKFPEAIAETRAESRALKKALGLRVLTADEKMEEEEDFSDDSMNETQKAVITTKCRALGIDPEKLSQHVLNKTFDVLLRTDAASLIQQISKYQSNNTGSKEIPKEIKVD